MRLAHYAMGAGATLLLSFNAHFQVAETLAGCEHCLTPCVFLTANGTTWAVGVDCTEDTDCITGCCGGAMDDPQCLDALTQGADEACQTLDGCDCAIGLCIDGFCPPGTPSPITTYEDCEVDTDCLSGCCASQLDDPVCIPKATQLPGAVCDTEDGCDCLYGLCINRLCPVVVPLPDPAPVPVLPPTPHPSIYPTPYPTPVYPPDGCNGLAQNTGTDYAVLAARATWPPTLTPTPWYYPTYDSTLPTQEPPTPTPTPWYYPTYDSTLPPQGTPAPSVPGTPGGPTSPPSGAGPSSPPTGGLPTSPPAPAAPTSPPAPSPVCHPGTSMCDDPHMQGLRGQKIDWSGVDGGWYCMVTDNDARLHVNIRLTAPLPKEFPDRQLITGLSIISDGHSLVVEVTNPYDTDTNGCTNGVSPCLADGGLRAIVDGEDVDGLLGFSRNEYVADGMTVSASNLPVECRQFGGDQIWVRMYDEMLTGRRKLAVDETLETWILRFDHMAAPDWCKQYIAKNNLADVQSNHAVFKIVTPSVTVRLNVGTNYQGNGELDWDGRILPDLEFWQMDVGLHGLSLESESLSGILGETARPVFDEEGHAVMEGYEAFRGTVEDYRVSNPLGTHFALLAKQYGEGI